METALLQNLQKGAPRRPVPVAAELGAKEYANAGESINFFVSFFGSLCGYLVGTRKLYPHLWCNAERIGRIGARLYGRGKVQG